MGQILLPNSCPLITPGIIIGHAAEGVRPRIAAHTAVNKSELRLRLTVDYMLRLRVTLSEGVQEAEGLFFARLVSSASVKICASRARLLNDCLRAGAYLYLQTNFEA